MKELVNYLVENGPKLLLLLAVVLFAGLWIIPRFFSSAGDTGAGGATDTPVPDQANPPFEGDGDVQVQTGGAPLAGDEPTPTYTPEAACFPADECTPSFKVVGQYCQSGVPYTNIELQSPGELHFPMPAGTETESDDVLVITATKPDGTSEAYYLHDSGALTIAVGTPVSHDLSMAVGARAECVMIESADGGRAARLNCTGPEAGTGYVLVAASCPCQSPAFAFHQVPFGACSPGENRGGEAPAATPTKAGR